MHTRRDMVMLVALLAVGLGLGLAGCDKTSQEPQADAGAEGGAGALVNSTCPIMTANDVPADTKFTRTFDGMAVGFCCGGCPAKWDALSDEEKHAKLAAAVGCTGDGCDCALCAAGEAAEAVQCTGEEGCQRAHCAAAEAGDAVEAVQCTGEEGCQCSHCAPAEVEAVQCTGEADCQCPHCAS